MLAAESWRVALKKQRADKTLGAQRRQRGHPLYLAVHDLGLWADEPHEHSHEHSLMTQSSALRIMAGALRFHCE